MRFESGENTMEGAQKRQENIKNNAEDYILTE